MDTRRVCRMALMIAAAGALSLACGKGAGPRPAAPPPPHDQAVYARETPESREANYLAADLSHFTHPTDLLSFTQLFHLPPVQQGKTGTCWAFSTTSLLESELRRGGQAEVKLSEMHTVYWEYVEKARRFLHEKGKSFLGQGSEPNSALARIKQYGLVRESDYSGLLDGRTAHDHAALFREFHDYLDSLAAKNAWDEAAGIAGVRAILDRHLGRPPDHITVEGRSLTPLEYLASLGLKPEDYVSFLSFMSLPFYTRGEYKVPDNWWHSAEFYNLPLYEFTLAFQRALRKGFTATVAVDFSEPGYLGQDNVAMVPTFDIPSAYIDQSSREFRFANGTSTDDHAVHCVGYLESGPGHWFLIKDSWENAWWGPIKGYFFYQDDYFRLKVLMFMVHKDAVKDILQKFPAAE